MQKIIEFKKTGFLGSVDLNALNEKIYQLNQDGWRVVNIAPITGSFGQTKGYALVIESDEAK